MSELDTSLEHPDCHLLSPAALDHLLQQGVPEAELVFGIRFNFGIATAVDSNRGWEFILRASDKGHPVARGCAHAKGKCAKADVKYGLALLRESADRGHPIGEHTITIYITVLCCCTLSTRTGIHMYAALAFEKPCEEKRVYWQRAAEQGFTPSKLWLGITYCKEKNPAEYVRLVREASRDFYSEAIVEESVIYEKGITVAVDPARSFTLAERAWGLCASGVRTLAHCWNKAVGVKRDSVNARALYEIAKELGDARSKEFISKFLFLDVQGKSKVTKLKPEFKQLRIANAEHFRLVASIVPMYEHGKSLTLHDVMGHQLNPAMRNSRVFCVSIVLTRSAS